MSSDRPVPATNRAQMGSAAADPVSPIGSFLSFPIHATTAYGPEIPANQASTYPSVVPLFPAAPGPTPYFTALFPVPWCITVRRTSVASQRDAAV